MSEAHYHKEQQYWDGRGETDYVSLSTHDQQRIAEWLDWRGPGTVLDIGGGSGMVSRLLAGDSATLPVCLDISHAMLRHARVPCVQGNALALPFRSECFDLVVAAAFLHHLPEQAAELGRECLRVLRPGGRLVGYDPNARCVQNRLFMSDGPLRLRFFSPDERPLIPEQLGNTLEGCGFAAFRFDLFSFRNPRLTPFEFIQRFLLSPFAVGPLQSYLHRWFFWSAQRP